MVYQYFNGWIMGSCKNWFQLDLNQNQQMSLAQQISDLDNVTGVILLDIDHGGDSDVGLNINPFEFQRLKSQQAELGLNSTFAVRVCQPFNVEKHIQRIENNLITREIFRQFSLKLGMGELSLRDFLTRSKLMISEIESLCDIGDIILKKYTRIPQGSDTPKLVAFDLKVVQALFERLFQLYSLGLTEKAVTLSQNFINIDEFPFKIKNESTGRWETKTRDGMLRDYVAQLTSLVSLSIYSRIIENRFPKLKESSDILSKILFQVEEITQKLIQGKIVSCDNRPQYSDPSEIASYNVFRNYIIYNNSSFVNLEQLNEILFFPALSFIIHELIHANQDNSLRQVRVHRAEAEGWFVTALVATMMLDKDQFKVMFDKLLNQNSDENPEKKDALHKAEAAMGASFRKDFAKRWRESNYKLMAINFAKEFMTEYDSDPTEAVKKLDQKLDTLADAYASYHGIDYISIIMGMILDPKFSSKMGEFLVFEKEDKSQSIKTRLANMDDVKVSDLKKSVDDVIDFYDMLYKDNKIVIMNRSQDLLKKLVITLIQYMIHHKDNPNFDSKKYLDEVLLPASRLLYSAQASRKVNLGIK